MKTQEPTITRPSIDGLRSRAALLSKQLQTLAIKALEDPSALIERVKVREELDCLPAQIGELRRKEVLEHIAKMAQQAQELAPQVVAAQAAVDAYNSQYAVLEHARRKTPVLEQGELQGQLHRLTKQGEADGLAAHLMYSTAKLDALYALATRSYQVFLDQSGRQRLHRDGLHPTLSFEAASTESAWEQAALRIGALAEAEARKELFGNGSGLPRMRV